MVSGLLFPVIPQKMGELRRTLGLPEEKIEPHLSDLAQWGGLTPGSRIASLTGLFPRIKKPKPAPETALPSTEIMPTEVELCDIADVGKLGLTTAVILEAKAVEGADRLLQIEIDLGAEKRQIVAGIAKQYTSDQLVGKTVVVVANLKPAKIRGVSSNGMLLAAKKGKKLRLLTVDEGAPGGWRIS